MAEQRLRITCGEHEVSVYPLRFGDEFSETVRPILRKGPRTAFFQFRADEFIEMDRLAEMVLLGYAQTGVVMSRGEARLHPIVVQWDVDGGQAFFEEVPVQGLQAAITEVDAEVAPDPLP